MAGNGGSAVEFSPMKTRTEPDASETAARVVGETIARHSEPLPVDVEQAWEAWSAGVGDADPRMMALLKAAFKAGAKVGAAIARK